MSKASQIGGGVAGLALVAGVVLGVLRLAAAPVLPTSALVRDGGVDGGAIDCLPLSPSITPDHWSRDLVVVTTASTRGYRIVETGLSWDDAVTALAAHGVSISEAGGNHDFRETIASPSHSECAVFFIGALSESVPANCATGGCVP